MKKSIILLACASMLFASCNEFLDEDPKSFESLKGMYKNESQAQSNVNYLYRTGCLSMYTNGGSAYIGPFASVTGMLTGYFVNSYEGQENVCKYARELTRQAQTNNVSGTVDAVWDGCYAAINTANAALKYIPDINMDETNKATLLSEAKFFRAFNYYYLVKTFGDVPFYTEPYIEGKNMELPRTEAATVYAQIEKDLQEAVKVLPAKSFVANGHRISKYVAEQLLSTVYMQQGKYAEALPYLKDIISSRAFQLTANTDQGLGSAYNKLRTTDDLQEVVYSYEYDDAISNSGWWPTYAFSSSAVGVFDKYAIFERVYGPYKRFLNIYDDNDLRGQEKQFFAKSYTNPVNGKTWTAPNEDEMGCWYYFDEEALEVSGRGTKDINIFRYAETLLDAAECIAQTTGPTAEAASYLAQIQARANTEGKTADEIAATLQQLTKEKFIETCWTERLREFPLEFKIWDDCLRTKKFPVISETIKGEVTYVDLVGATNGSGAKFTESDLLWPISLNEIQRNPKLTQNPGYKTHN